MVSFRRFWTKMKKNWKSDVLVITIKLLDDSFNFRQIFFSGGEPCIHNGIYLAFSRFIFFEVKHKDEPKTFVYVDAGFHLLSHGCDSLIALVECFFPFCSHSDCPIFHFDEVLGGSNSPMPSQLTRIFHNLSHLLLDLHHFHVVWNFVWFIGLWRLYFEIGNHCEYYRILLIFNDFHVRLEVMLNIRQHR